MASVVERFGPRGVQVVGVQSPEFEQEKDLDVVRAAVQKLGVVWPVYVDNDAAMWDGLGTEAWPSLYLVDRKGNIRVTHVGEIHANTADAKRLEDQIQALLREPA